MNADSTRIAGVLSIPLTPSIDDRGSFVELFRQQRSPDFRPVQWNLSHSETNVLRGFHSHSRHTDLLFVTSGCLRLALRDLRVDSPTLGVCSVVEVHPSEASILIPAGVGHGFYFAEPTDLVFCVSHEWDSDDELACRWDDPELGIDWGCADPIQSPQDRVSGSLAEMIAVLRSRGV